MLIKQQQGSIIQVKNQNTVIKMPALNIVHLGNVNRVFSNVKRPSIHGGEMEQLNYGSSSSDDSKQKAKIKDIVYDPRQRKRLLDSLNIVTTRDKWRSLNQSD